MKLQLREPQARFSPCRIQIPPIRIIKTPMRLLITRITALNARLIAHLETKGLCPPAAGAHRKAQNSGLLSMLMRLAYISVGLWPSRTEPHFLGESEVGVILNGHSERSLLRI